MIDLYDERNANMRLQHSVIRIGGDPVFIDHVEQVDAGRFRLAYHQVGVAKHHVIHWGHKSIDYVPVPTGFVNMQRSIVLVDRYPNRQWKIGICRGNCKVTAFDGKRTPEIGALLDSRAFGKTVYNDFPKFESVHELFNNKSTVAVSRDFAVRLDGYLIHRHIGKVGRKGLDDKYELFDKHFYLQELLETVQ